MSVKKKIIILLAIFLIFGVIFTIIFINRTTPEEEMLEESHNYAVNTTAMTEETLPTVTEEIPEEVYESVAPTVSILYNEDMLTTEQAVVSDHLEEMVLDYGISDVTSVDIISSTDNLTIMNVHYADLDDEMVVATYDSYDLHDYLRVVNQDYYNDIMNGANVGYDEEG